MSLYLGYLLLAVSAMRHPMRGGDVLSTGAYWGANILLGLN